MGFYFSRNRAWVHIAFYDEYANTHIGYSAGLACLVMIPCYVYGLYVNRSKEQMAAAMMYSWHFTEKRNRLTHNMIMEHFEIHTEQLQDLIVELKKDGTKAFDGIQESDADFKAMDLNQDDLAWLDDVSGLSGFIEDLIKNNSVPQATIDQLRARVIPYSGAKSKEQVDFEAHEKFFGRQR